MTFEYYLRDSVKEAVHGRQQTSFMVINFKLFTRVYMYRGILQMS